LNIAKLPELFSQVLTQCLFGRPLTAVSTSPFIGLD